MQTPHILDTTPWVSGWAKILQEDKLLSFKWLNNQQPNDKGMHYFSYGEYRARPEELTSYIISNSHDDLYNSILTGVTYKMKQPAHPHDRKIEDILSTLTQYHQAKPTDYLSGATFVPYSLAMNFKDETLKAVYLFDHSKSEFAFIPQEAVFDKKGNLKEAKFYDRENAVKKTYQYHENGRLVKLENKIDLHNGISHAKDYQVNKLIHAAQFDANGQAIALATHNKNWRAKANLRWGEHFEQTLFTELVAEEAQAKHLWQNYKAKIDWQ